MDLVAVVVCKQDRLPRKRLLQVEVPKQVLAVQQELEVQVLMVVQAHMVQVAVAAEVVMVVMVVHLSETVAVVVMAPLLFLTLQVMLEFYQQQEMLSLVSSMTNEFIFLLIQPQQTHLLVQ
jgi:hypothetical protein